MKTTLGTDLTVRDICAGFEYNAAESKGLYGWGGKLTIQPEYQRHYLYAEKGGDTRIDNCQMLCKAHNRSKGND